MKDNQEIPLNGKSILFIKESGHYEINDSDIVVTNGDFLDALTLNRETNLVVENGQNCCCVTLLTNYDSKHTMKSKVIFMPQMPKNHLCHHAGVGIPEENHRSGNILNPYGDEFDSFKEVKPYLNEMGFKKIDERSA